MGGQAGAEAEGKVGDCPAWLLMGEVLGCLSPTPLESHFLSHKLRKCTGRTVPPGRQLNLLNGFCSCTCSFWKARTQASTLQSRVKPTGVWPLGMRPTALFCLPAALSLSKLGEPAFPGGSQCWHNSPPS